MSSGKKKIGACLGSINPFFPPLFALSSQDGGREKESVFRALVPKIEQVLRKGQRKESECVENTSFVSLVLGSSGSQFLVC